MVVTYPIIQENAEQNTATTVLAFEQTSSCHVVMIQDSQENTETAAKFSRGTVNSV